MNLGTVETAADFVGTALLAAELGTVSETLSRTLAKFREQGLVRVKAKSVMILSPKRLEQLLKRNLGE